MSVGGGSGWPVSRMIRINSMLAQKTLSTRGVPVAAERFVSCLWIGRARRDFEAVVWGRRRAMSAAPKPFATSVGTCGRRTYG